MDMLFYFLINIFCLLACFTIPLIFPVKFRHILLLFIVAVLTNVLHMIFNLELHTFFTIGILVLTLFICTGRNAVNIICALTTYLLSVVLNHLLIFLMARILHTSTNRIVTDFQQPFMIIFLTLLVITSYSLRFLFTWLYNNYLKNLPDKIYIYLLLEILSCVGVYILNITITHSYQHSKLIMAASTILYIAYFAISSLMLILVTRTIRKDSELKNQLLQYEAMQTYTEQLEQAYSEYRTFKHDYSNILLSMSQYIDSNDMSGLKDYFQENILPAGQLLTASDKQLGRLSAIKLPAIKSILSSKLIYAISRKIHVNIEIPSNVSEVAIMSLDLTRVLGIFLDNAIEAALLTEDKILNLTIVTMQNHTMWQIENSCNQTIRLDRLKEPGYSTKGENRGIGLYSASQIISKYPNIDWDITCKDKRFSQILIIHTEV